MNNKKHVLTIIQEKGGVGKSLATFNIASYLKTKGKVLVIDFDGQAANITYYMLGHRIEDISSIKTIIDVFEGRSNLSDVILNVDENLDIIPANYALVNLSEEHSFTSFQKYIMELKETYDFILIDVNPNPTRAHVLALSAPGQNIIPIINADMPSLKALSSIHVSLQEIINYNINTDVKYLGIIMNRYDSRTNVSKEVLEQANLMAKQMGTSLFETKIRQSVIFSEQIIVHKNIFEYAASSKAAKDYGLLGEEIYNRLNKND